MARRVVKVRGLDLLSTNPSRFLVWIGGFLPVSPCDRAAVGVTAILVGGPSLRRMVIRAGRQTAKSSEIGIERTPFWAEGKAALSARD